MSKGGGGASGTTKYEWNEDLAPWWRSQISYSEDLKNRPYEAYPYERVADLDPYHLAAQDKIQGLVNTGGTPVGRAADDVMYRTLAGDYLDGGSGNPYADPYGDLFQDTLRSGMEDITNAYKEGTSADTTRLFNLSGAFGGSAHQKAVANNEQGLGKTLGNFASGMMNDQYNRSGNWWEGERSRQLGVIPNALTGDQRALTLANAEMGLGDMNRSIEQERMNVYGQDWQDQQNHPYRMEDWFTGLLSRAQGGVSPNMTQTGYSQQASPFSQLLGAGLLGRSAGWF